MRSRLILSVFLLCAACGKSHRSTIVMPPDEPPAAAKSAMVFPVSFAHPNIGTVPADQRRHVLIYSDDGAHGWMQHENTAGAILLGKRLAKAVPGCEVSVWRDEFPGAEALQSAASVVLFCSGTDRHPLNKAENLAGLEKAMQAGKGLVVLHWALEAGTPEGSAFLKNYLGGCFEVDHSVNPMWLAEFKSVPPHPATSGVAPFSIYDEFYFNMRFPDVPGTRTTLLEAVPPKKVILLPPDGPRSNNPVVRGSLGKPHVTAWAFGRPGGGRSVGYTGGHFHWDWKHDDKRRMLLNAMAWTAGIEVPPGGVPDTRPSDAELMENQDSEPVPGWEPMPGQPARDTPAAHRPQA